MLLNVLFSVLWNTCWPVVDFQEEDNAEAVGMEEDGDDVMPDLESLNYDDLDSVSKLQKTQQYNDIMQVCHSSLIYWKQKKQSICWGFQLTVQAHSTPDTK
jgi:hypothetical protein